MSNDKGNAKERIFEETLKLILAGKSEEEISTREIASKAGVNHALINYYYQTKENLISRVVGTMMSEIAENSNAFYNGDSDALSRLQNMLLSTADAAFEYRNICKIAISLELKAGCVNSCQLVMPLLKEILFDCDEVEIHIIAMQLMVPFHHIVLSPENYNEYLNTDFYDSKKRKHTIIRMIDCALNNKKKENNNEK